MQRRLRVAGGKTLALDTECHDGSIVRITISGDFFFFPEEGLEKLESYLVEEKVWSSGDPEKAISGFLSERGYRAVGFGPADLAFLLRGLKC